MSQLVMHIGRHKSGTSSLQHWLSRNRDQLADQGICYPFAGGSNVIAHHLLADALNPVRDTDHDLDDITAKIAAERKDMDTLLLSSEAFQNITDMSRVQHFVSALGVTHVRVICYVREHMDYAVSAYRQMIHAQPRFLTFRDFIARFQSMDTFVARWRAIGDLDLSWYDRSLLRDGDIVCDFCHRVGIHAQDFGIADKNPSIGGNLLSYKLAANHLKREAGSYKELSALATAHGQFRQGFRISPSSAARIRSDSTYNASLFDQIGPVAMKQWDNMPSTPNLDTIDADVSLIEEALNGRLAQDHVDAMRASAEWFSLDDV